jgi:hypothetical protein
MPGNESTMPVIYEAVNRELNTVKDYFAQAGISVLDIQWLQGVEENEDITAGRLLGHIIWANCPPVPLVAPEGCTGEIEWINGRIELEKLHLATQKLLRLKAG